MVEMSLVQCVIETIGFHDNGISKAASAPRDVINCTLVGVID